MMYSRMNLQAVGSTPEEAERRLRQKFAPLSTMSGWRVVEGGDIILTDQTVRGEEDVWQASIQLRRSAQEFPCHHGKPESECLECTPY